MLISKKSYLLGFELSPRQSVIVDHLVPSVCACVLYVSIIAVDAGVCYSCWQNHDPIWASLTIFLMFLPALCSYVIVVSDWRLWPELEGCGRQNVVWFSAKTSEHLFFPFWSMWRFAERIFWSIEGILATRTATEDVKAALAKPRSIELYVFLQSYMHSLPQVLLQLNILMVNGGSSMRGKESVHVASVVINLAKVAVTTVYYQRFKSQKLAGKEYPWFKHFKSQNEDWTDNEVQNMTASSSPRHPARCTTSSYDVRPTRVERHSSDAYYLEPTPSECRTKEVTTRGSHEVQVTRESDVDIDEGDGLQAKRYPFGRKRETTVQEVLERILSRESGTSEPDFNISRVIKIEGLADDDLAGRLVAFLWWFAFLLARVLAITVFAHFFREAAIWTLVSHFLLILLLLSYDLRTNEVKRAKAVFFIFIGLVYIFCIIEFKIRFKKANLIYYGFFALVFLENLVMCLCWYLDAVDSIENDYWFRYVFYIVVMCSITSFCAMLFYFMVNKPPKMVVGEKLADK